MSGAQVTTRVHTPDGLIGLTVTLGRHGCADRVAVSHHGTGRPRHAEDVVAVINMLLSKDWLAKGIAAALRDCAPADSLLVQIAEAVVRAEEDARLVRACGGPEEGAQLHPLTWRGRGKGPGGKEGA